MLLWIVGAALIVQLTQHIVHALPAETSNNEEHAEIASQVVQQLQALGNHRGLMLPVPARSAQAAQPAVIETAAYYEPYSSQDYYKFEPAEPPSSDLTPSGINVNAALGFISYLLLLTLLQSAVEGVASRAPSSRRRRDIEMPSLPWPPAERYKTASMLALNGTRFRRHLRH